MTPDKTPDEASHEEGLPAPKQPEALPSPATAGERTPGESYPAKPVHLPEPTYWPFFLAIGITFIGWGLISTWLITVGGLIVLVISLVGWINTLRHE